MVPRYLPIEEVIEAVSRAAKLVIGEESVPLMHAVGRVCAREYRSPVEIPPADTSAVDGYAVKSSDVSSATPTNPVELRLVQRDELGFGEAKRVFTGDPLPRGADAVVMEEFCEDLGTRVLVYHAVAPWQNVRRRGEDLARGRKIVCRGEVLRPWHIAALASIGVSEVVVLERIRVGILVVGSEVVEPSEGLRAYEVGKVLNSTGYVVYAALAEHVFFEPVYLGIVPDDVGEIAEKLRESLQRCHAIVTCGGTGPSSRDVTVSSVEAVGGKILTRGVAMRPGRPTSVAVVEGKPVYMLSGFPVAAFLGVKYVVIPSLTCLAGISYEAPRASAKLSSRLASDPNYTNFARIKLVTVGNDFVAEPVAIKGSGNISSLLEANAVAIVPRGVEGFEKGSRIIVDVL